MQAGIALLRTIVGGLFMGHGLQKLTGWFGGGGLRQTGDFFEANLGLKPGIAHAGAAGAAEAGGGALLAAGLATPVGASLLSATMITAIRKVHAPKGVWATNGGYEYNLVLLAIVFAITDVGPGRLSLDAAGGKERKGLGWALAQLAAGAFGSAVAVAIGERGNGPSQAAAAASNGSVESAAAQAAA
jgi:putative oxidoreductase